MVEAAAVLILATAALSGVRAQSVFHSDTREVVVDVTVTDGKGAPVQGLTKDDFSITDEGKPRTISGFSTAPDFKPISGLPANPLHPPDPGTAGRPAPVGGHSTAIILDEVNSYFEDAAQARKNVLDLMAKVPADERIALYAIVRRQGLLLLQDYTTDRDALRHALEKHRPTGMRPNVGAMGQTPGGLSGFDEPPQDPRTHTRKAQDLKCADELGLSPAEAIGGDQNYPPWDSPLVDCSELLDAWRRNADDARLSLQRLSEQLAPLPGRKSIFWVTEAFPRWLLRGAYESAWDKTIHALNEANAAVNTIDTRGTISYGEPATGAISSMIQIAERTGGKAYFYRNDIDGALEQGIAASRVIYTLRFAIPDSERDKKFHVLKVKVDRPGVQVYARQGYYAGGEEQPTDLITSKIEGAALEQKASGAAALPAFVQVPYFYTGANRASVHLALEMEDPSVLKGQTEIVGITLRPDGAEASRFADTIAPDAGGRYEHAFTLAAGSYKLRITVGSGASVIGVKEVPLTIAPWSAGTFGMGQIALSVGAPAVSGPPRPGELIAANHEFTPAARESFQKSDRVYFYTEFDDAANPAAITLQFRVVDATSGAITFEGPKGSIASFLRPGNPVVPVATIVPFAQLTPGSYRLEVTGGHAGKAETLTRSIDFELRP